MPKNGFRRIFIDATKRFEKNEKYERGAPTFDKNQDHRIIRDPYENRDGKMSGKILGEKARAEIKIVIDILRQDLISCNVYLIGITKPGEDLIRKQEMLVKIQEIIVYLREVSDACTKTDDILGYAMKEMSNFEERMKAFEEIVRNKFSYLENVSEKLMTFEKCWRSSFSIALKKLRNMDKEKF